MMKNTQSVGVARKVWGVAYQYGYGMTLGTIPRALLGNDAGVMNNLRATNELRRFQRASSPTLGPIGRNESADFLRVQGYAPVNEHYAPELLATITKRFRDAISDPVRSKPTGTKYPEAQRTIIRPLDVIPEIEELLSPPVQDIFRTFYRSHLKIEHVRVWRNKALPEQMRDKDVFSNLWHNDGQPITTLRYFVYLSDGVDRDTGALRLIPRPQTKQLMRSGYFRRRAIYGRAKRTLNDPSQQVFFEGGVGSAFILNPQLCLHRAGVPRTGSQRDIVQFTLSPSDRSLSKTWPRELPPDPEVE